MNREKGTYKGHKAHASTNVPHLNGLVSRSRKQERPRLTALLSLQGERKEKKKYFVKIRYSA